MEKVTVDLDNSSPYLQLDTKLNRFKNKLKMKTVLKRIRKIVKKNPNFSLLEIGTGSGYLISLIESEYPKANLTGIEYDPRLVELTKKKVRYASIIQGNAENLDLKNKIFDIIVTLQVIEHLYRPDLMLLSVKKYLRKNGILILTTPNLEGLGAKIMKNKWIGYRDDHVSLKGYTSWKMYIEKFGFESIYCGSTFFTGLPIFNKFPLGLFNWSLLFFKGSMVWKHGESFIGLFKATNNEKRNN